MSCRLVFRFQVKFVQFPWKSSYSFKATGVVWQNLLLSKWESVHRSPAVVWVLDFPWGYWVSRLQNLLWQLVDMCTRCWRSTLWSILHGNCVCMYWICLLCCCCHWCCLRGCGGPERRCWLWIFALAMHCLLSFPYVTQYLEYIQCTIGCSHFVSTHFAETRHIFSFNDHIPGVIWKQYTHPEYSTITE